MTLRIASEPRILEAVAELAPPDSNGATLDAIAAHAGVGQGKAAINLKALMKRGIVERREDLDTGISGYRLLRTLGDGTPDDGVLWDSSKPKGERLGSGEVVNERVSLSQRRLEAGEDGVIEGDAEELDAAPELEAYVCAFGPEGCVDGEPVRCAVCSEPACDAHGDYPNDAAYHAGDWRCPNHRDLAHYPVDG